MDIANRLRDAAARIRRLPRASGVYVFLLIFLSALFVIGEVLTPGFTNPRHLAVILRQASFLGLVSVGQTFVIITGGIDLSVGPIVTAGNILTCELLGRYGHLTLPVVLLILALGFGIGIGNGLGIVYLRIPPLIMTMAVGAIVSGLTLLYCRGSSAGFATPPVQYLGSHIFFGVLPFNFLIWVGVIAFTIFLLQRTIFGRKVFAIGANERAAHASGVDVHRTKILVYGLSGFTAVLAGVLLAGYTQTGFVGIGETYTLASIATVVIGGTSIIGGQGGLIGSFIGALILTVIKSLLTVLRIPEPGKFIVEGVVILLLIMMYVRRKHRT